MRPYGPIAVAATALLVTAVGVWASGRVERRLGIKDPQIVCVDEVAGVLVTWIAAPPTWRALIVGGLLFRLFDQIKPWPARAAEKLPGGWGVMLDDVAAGAWGAAVSSAPRAGAGFSCPAARPFSRAATGGTRSASGAGPMVGGGKGREVSPAPRPWTPQAFDGGVHRRDVDAARATGGDRGEHRDERAALIRPRSRPCAGRRRS